MLDNEPTGVTTGDAEGTADERSTDGRTTASDPHRAASRPAGPPPETDDAPAITPAPPTATAPPPSTVAGATTANETPSATTSTTATSGGVPSSASSFAGASSVAPFGAPATGTSGVNRGLGAPDAMPAPAGTEAAGETSGDGAADEAGEKPARGRAPRTRRATRPAAPAPEVPEVDTAPSEATRPSARAEALASSAFDREAPAADPTGFHQAGPAVGATAAPSGADHGGMSTASGDGREAADPTGPHQTGAGTGGTPARPSTHSGADYGGTGTASGDGREAAGDTSNADSAATSDTASAAGEAEEKPARRRATRTRRATRPAAPAPEVPDDNAVPSGRTENAADAGGAGPATHGQADDGVREAGESQEPAQPKRRRSRAKAAPETAREDRDGSAEEGRDDSGQDGTQGTPAVPGVPTAVPYAAPSSASEEENGAATPSFLAPVMFRAPEPAVVRQRERANADETEPEGQTADNGADYDDEDDGDEERGNGRRRRRRGGRGRTKKGGDGESAQGDEPEDKNAKGGKNGRAAKNGKADDDGKNDGKNDRKSAAKGDDEAKAGKQGKNGQDAQDGESDDEADQNGDGSSRRRRRRRRRAGSSDAEGTPGNDDPENTVVKIRPARESKPEDEVQSLRGSTRLEAKKQRRREGREQGRRRPPIITESEFLARRESVERVMAVRRVGDRTQIGVLEDGVLVEHYVDRSTQQSYVGNVYLGKVQNVLPSMEAAFVDIGKGRNAVLYAGEVNFDATGLEGQPKRIESALKSGQSVLVQVTKDPVGHKGARLTSQVSLPGRYLVYVPEGSMTGISRKLPDSERSRLKQILKKVMPEDAGVIVRTAAEGASEEELAGDIERLAAQWEQIKKKAKTAQAPALLHGEPDMTVRVVRDIFNEDFKELLVSGEAWETVDEYVNWVAPALAERLQRWTGDRDLFEAYRIDEQIAKALERKVWLPSGGSLVIDRTEAMTVIDVNTGKFTGQGGNLEETVTKNNLEAAEEIVRQLRLRDIGGIIVIDFIDMVLEANRDLVLRRLLECLARDRTKHQVAEVTSLGLVQMTRKRVGQGLLEAFSETCEHCNGRGILIHTEPVEPKPPRGVVPAEKSRKRRKGKQEEPAEPPAADQSASEQGPDDDESPVDAVADAAEAVTDIAAERAGASVEPVTDKPKRRRSRRTKTDKPENAEGDKTEDAAVGE